mmetsp:Transcript_24908/g.68677  ORF Transcript_24908/g.68677 Transcript_24908/m.68677 type:complete len:119 (-) Transcript_24908:1738-2094(-)
MVTNIGFNTEYPMSGVSDSNEFSFAQSNSTKVAQGRFEVSPSREKIKRWPSLSRQKYRRYGTSDPFVSVFLFDSKANSEVTRLKRKVEVVFNSCNANSLYISMSSRSIVSSTLTTFPS